MKLTSDEQLSELRYRLNQLNSRYGETVRDVVLLKKQVTAAHREPQQERFNGEVVEILDLIVTELRRMREGKSLSNLAGIEHQVKRLEQDMQFR